MKQNNHIRYQVEAEDNGIWLPMIRLRKFKTYDGAANAMRKIQDGYPHRISTVPADGYHFEDCRGEAHSNAFIDNCMACMPMWGRVVVKDSISPKRGEPGHPDFGLSLESEQN